MKVELKIYDVTGRLVRKLVDDVQESGLKQIVWDRKDEKGKPVSSGVYFCKLIINNLYSLTRGIVVL